MARTSGNTMINTAIALLLLAAACVGGWLAWQFFGTNAVSEHHQSEIKQHMATEWKKGKDFGDAIALIRIKRFGKDWEKPVVTGISDDTLARGVAWDDSSAKPGQIGNVVLAGHRVTRGEPFKNFPELRTGDLVELETRTHIYTYRLTADGTANRVTKHESWVSLPVPNPDYKKLQPKQALLTMYTCAALFKTDQRDVVFGELIRAETTG